MIGRLSPFRFAEVHYHYHMNQNRGDYQFFLIKDPRILISQMALLAIMGWVAMIMLVDTFVI